MLAKFEITGTMTVLTGMHIGGSSTFAAIGAVDSPVVRDPLSDLPIVPGSSLKGKMRSLLAQKYNDKKIVHSCNEDAVEILRLFGNTKDSTKPKRSRLQFGDMILSNMEDLRAAGLYSSTEVKFENSIDRLRAVANPRQIERVIRGAKFPVSIIYNVEESDEAVTDISILADGIRLLQFDYLGGSGSRGYGRVKFEGLELNKVSGEVHCDIIKACKEKIKELSYDL